MRIRWDEWLEKWKMTYLKINLKFLEMDWEPSDPDRAAAWDLYVELLTRITTQPLPAEYGDESTALESIHSLFPLTRETLRRHGRGCKEFSKIAIVILNQIVRPFTARWHKDSLAGAFDDAAQRETFRDELAQLQGQLRVYSGMLAEMAGVEDLTELEEQ